MAPSGGTLRVAPGERGRPLSGARVAMRCNPARWLWGLIPIAMLSWITYQWERAAIETDLARRAAQGLEEAGEGWAEAGFDGRDAVISGKAPKDGAAKKALDAVRSVWGVRVTSLRTDMAGDAAPYAWSAAHGPGALKLGGFAPDKETRRAILALARGAFPKASIENEVKIAAGGPGKDLWLEEIGFALTQLAGLKRGAVEIRGTTLRIEGEAAGIPAFKALGRALAGELPKGLKIARSSVSPPIADPFHWSARLAEGQLVLSGYVPSEQIRSALFSSAKRGFPRFVIVDHTELAAGAPQGFMGAAEAELLLLRRLREGEAVVRGSELSLTGTAESEAAARSVREAIAADNRFRGAAPGDIKVAAAGAAPAEPQQGSDALRTIVDAVGGTAGFTGLLPGEAARRAAFEADLRERMAAYSASRREAELRGEPSSYDEARANAEDARKSAAELEMRTRMEAYADARRAAELKTSKVETATVARSETTAAVRRAEAENCQKRLTEVAEQEVILFARASADIDPKSSSTLDKLAAIAKSCPGARIDIEGHTDGEGEPERNKSLSERRAGAVLAYLSKAGISSARLRAIGYGAARPRSPNDTAENRARNRRIEFTVVAE